MAEEERSPNAQINALTPGEDFSEDYANNFNFEHGSWDFKIVFGQTDQMSGKPQGINWHTAITMPWGVAKIMNHFLTLNIAAHEFQFGRVHIPKDSMPPEPIAPTGPDDTPSTRALHRIAQQLYRSLMGAEDLKPATIPTEPKIPE